MCKPFLACGLIQAGGGLDLSQTFLCLSVSVLHGSVWGDEDGGEAVGLEGEEDPLRRQPK